MSMSVWKARRNDRYRGNHSIAYLVTTLERLMRYPSVKTIERELTSRYTHSYLSPRLAAKAIRETMERDSVNIAMENINEILGLCGVECIPEGHNSKSPAIEYCNTGDTYDPTMMFINGSFRIGCWGDIVERGHYD